MVAAINEFRRLSVKQIELVSQVRKKFKKEGITELAASIDANGLLQPIIVRPSKRPSGKFVVLYGERRFRAVQSLGWEYIDAILTDDPGERTSERQVVENVQREDLDPMEEADAYAKLIKDSTIDELAAKVGRTVAYCYRRLKLNDLEPKLKKLLREGNLSIGAAEELARLEKSVQQRYLNQHRFYGDRTGGVEAIREFIRKHVRNDLAKAPFDKTDAKLVKGALPCLKCPKRTGFAPNLFDDDEELDGQDMCQDPGCYGAKMTAYLKARIAKETPVLLIALDHAHPPWLAKLNLKNILGNWEWTAKKEADGGKKGIVVCSTNQKHIGTIKYVTKGRQQFTHEPSATEKFNTRVTNWEHRVNSELAQREAAVVAKKITRVGRREAEFLVWSIWDESHYETKKTVIKLLGLEIPKKQQHGTTFHDEDTPLRKHLAGIKNVPAVLALAVVIATAPLATVNMGDAFYGAQDRDKKFKEMRKGMKIDRSKLRAEVVKEIPRPTKPKAKKATTKTSKRKAKK